jgi:hypothetical protein
MGTTFPDGRPASDFLVMGDGVDTLKVVPAFSEGQPAAYVTTEIWINYADVWLQPGFVQINDPTAADPFLRYADGTRAPALFDVGPASTFYSPFWQIDLAVVGPLVDVDHFQSTRSLRDAGIPTVPFEPHACPLRPVDVPVLGAAPGQVAVEPTWQTPLDAIPAIPAWVDGHRYGAFDFGAGTFSLEDHPNQGPGIEAIPFFLFYGPGGAAPLAGALEVGGVEPLDGASADPPRSGAFWRIYKATLPAGAGAFSSASFTGVAPTGVDLKDYDGRVAVDTSCFAAATFPDACSWLDSQHKIVAALPPSSIEATEIMTTRPWVFYGKKPVKR